jgi:hypothetical protein
VLFDELGMEGGDRCETSLNSTIMHLNDIAFDAPVLGVQYPMEGEATHKMGDAQLLVETMGITTKSLEQLTPLDTTNSRDLSNDIIPMMSKNHAHD